MAGLQSRWLWTSSNTKVWTPQIVPLDKGAIERFSRLSGHTDWAGGGTTRAPIEPKICLLRFFSSVNCPPAGNSIIQNSLGPIRGDFVHSILDLSSCPLEWKTSSSFEVLNLTWILMALHPLSMVDWCYVSLNAESDGFLIKMHKCHCYKPRLLWQDVCGRCPPLFFQLIKGEGGVSSYLREW